MRVKNMSKLHKPTEDLIDAIHRVRREMSALFDGNLVAIAEDAARRQALAGRPVWQPKMSFEVRLCSDSGQNSVSKAKNLRSEHLSAD